MSKSEIPASWGKTKLIDLCEAIADIDHKMPQGKENGVPFLSAKDVTKDGKLDFSRTKYISESDYEHYSRKIAPRRADIIYTRIGTIGRAAIVDTDATFIVSYSCCTIRTKKHFVDLSYLKEFITSPQCLDQALKEAKGIGVPDLGIQKIKQFEVPIPPLGEQKRIVEKIESTNEKIKLIEQSITKAEELIGKYREALLQKAFRGELLPQDPNDEPASKLLERIRADRAKIDSGKKKKKDDLPPINPDEIPFEIPKSWEWVRLGKICVKIGSGQTPRGGNSVYKSNGVPLIRSQNVLNGLLDLSDVAFIDKHIDEEMKGSRVLAGDVLYNITGGSIGRSCVIPEDFTSGNVNQHVLSIRPYFPNREISKFISLFLLSPFGKDFIFKNKKGAAREAITKAQIENLIFPLPPERELKKVIFSIQRLEDMISTMLSVMNTVENSISSLQNSVLNSAFSGRLVPQIPSEGTGNELLEKIKQLKHAELEPNAKRPTSKTKGKKKTRVKK